MYLKSDFRDALVAAIASRPAAATAFQAGDPRLLAQLDANATMLAMLSQQLDVAEVEPFVKARAGTVMADAALKGVLPLGKPARVRVTVANPGGSSVSIGVGRGVVDGKGRRYSVEGSATIPAAGSATITAQQVTVRQITHTVAGSAPFYSVQVPASAAGDVLTGIEVEDAGGPFTYTTEFCNVAPGARVFHVETDEYRRVFIRFGAEDAVAGLVVGHQPNNGDVLTITLRECGGKVELEAESGFALEYVGNAAEGRLALTLDAVLAEGAGPPETDTLRMLARYPALHDANAVFLSNFDFLLRRHLTGVSFLSVWNEQIEEQARGANVANINKLFVSFLITGQTTTVSQNQIRQIIARADDSYKVQFVTRRTVQVPVTVTVQVSVVHDTADVEAQIRTALLAEYGAGSVNASLGLKTLVRFQQINQLLSERVVALQDQISDFNVTVGSTPAPLPEDYRYLSDASITVVVTRIQSSTGLWNT
jgi:hypothetical protein